MVSQSWAKCSKIGQNFLNFDSLVFLEIAYNDSLQLCLTCSRGKTHENNFLGLTLGQRGRNRFQNQFFCHFLKFGSLIFLEFAYNDSLQQCLTCNKGKIYEKKFGSEFGPDTRFFVIFSSLVHQFSLKLHTMIACNNA